MKQLSSIIPDTSVTQQIITGSAISNLSKLQVHQLQSVIDEIPSLVNDHAFLDNSHNTSIFNTEDMQPLSFGPKATKLAR